ncbi:MAG: 16S rRNA (cytosine(1402)-N(4))-methyltransferase RsmH [Bacteroidales bacterium]|nr:16S rRNA (cytosine(1402)-N(4))-methyltransferase RsmH [Bacteroidales bacterium]
MTSYHNPVLLQQSVEGLHIRPDGVYVDVTFGSGQSSQAILQRLNPFGRLLAFDQDADAQANAPQDSRFTFISANFRHLKNYLQYHGVSRVDGILGDLGVSSHQFDVAERGFSTRFDGPLDMRMDRRKSLTAAHVLASYSIDELAGLFYRYGEVFNARRLAQMIVQAREHHPVATTSDLRELVMQCAPKNRENRYLAQVFQALRIEVNQEMEVLEEMLQQTIALLNPGGRLVIISYHSLEDRLVKQFMRSGNLQGTVEKDFYGNSQSPFRLVTRKAIVPDEAEMELNSRSRSAKLRICEKI